MSCLGGTLEALAAGVSTGSPGSAGHGLLGTTEASVALIGIGIFRDSGWQGLDMVNNAMNGKHQLQWQLEILSGSY